MLRENLLKNLDVLEAWANGAEIEQRFGLQPWEAVGNRILQMGDNFRIKPEDRYIPFDKSDIEFLKGKWIISKDSGDQEQITNFRTRDGKFLICAVEPIFLLEYFTFLDGTPCGKLKKDE